MRIHWYWPFARPEELDWAVATARPDDSILVEVLDRPEAPAAGVRGSVSVVRDLPDVDRRTRSTPVWLASRARTYVTRSRVRRRSWRQDDFDLVHLHYVNRFTDAFARLPHPLVMSVHDVTPHMPRLGTSSERLLLRHLYRRADALVVHHRRLADDLMQTFGAQSARIHVVPHQVFPVDRTTPRPANDTPTVLFFGALRANKGLPILADALETYIHDDVRVVIAGRGDPGIETLAFELAERDQRVTAEIGHISLARKRDLFNEASVVVLPYTSFSSQSGVLHDAYGHGRPVVVTDVGALGNTVREDGTGLVVPPGDARSLAEALIRSLDDASWQQFALAARQVAVDRSPTATGLRLRSVYDELFQRSD